MVGLNNLTQRIGCAITFLSISLAIAACNQPSKLEPAAEKVETHEQKQEEATSEVAPKEPESPAETVACTGSDDVRDSIDQCNKIIAAAKGLLKDAKNPEFPAQVGVLQERVSAWEEHNEVLRNGCGLLLGANGAQVFPEIPLALENLKRSGDWLHKSLKAASARDLCTSRLYMRATAKAINQATRLIDNKVKPRSRTAVVKTPRYLKKVEKEARIER